MKTSPFFKIRFWEDEQRSKVFVFIGDNHPASVKQLIQQIGKMGSVVALSKQEKQTLINVFGEEYEMHLGLNYTNKETKVVFIKGLINPEDNINWLKQKLYYYLHTHLSLMSHEDVYMWINKSFSVTSLVIQTFLNNCFKSEKRIATDYFSHNVVNYFGVLLPQIPSQFVDTVQARKYLEGIKVAHQTEPIFFHYTSEDFFEFVNYHPLLEGKRTSSSYDIVDKLSLSTYNPNLLESFDLQHIVDGCLNAIDVKTYKTLVGNSGSKKVSKFFPFSQSIRSSDYTSTTLKFVEDIEEAEKLIQEHNIQGGHNLDTFTNFLHVRVNELNPNKRQDLEILFEELNTSQEVPFIKYKAITNTYYKVHKESMFKLRNELLGKWTESIKVQPGKSSNLSYISLKVHYTKDIYCSVLIFDTLFYDVKFTFGSMMRETSTNILKFMTKIDGIIKKVQSVFPDASIPLIDVRFLTNPQSISNTKVLRWLSTNSIKSDKHNLNYGNFIKVIKNRMFSYFNIINNPNKNILHLQYKKIDNYLKFENIQVYITNHFIVNRGDMIKNIQREFNLSPEEAEREYEKWTSQNELEMFKMGDKTFIKPKNDNYVNVKIRLTSSIDLNFNIEGAKSHITQDRIIHLLLVLMDMSHEKILEKKNVHDTRIDAIIYGNSSSNVGNSGLFMSPPKLSRRSSAKRNDDDFADLDLGGLEDYEDVGEMFEDFDDLKALEEEFLKDLQNEEKLNIKGATKKISKGSTQDEDEDENAKTGDEDSIMKSYFMNMLKSADKDLIDYKVPKGQKVLKRYSTVCQWNDRRQPVVVNKNELEKIQGFQKDIRFVKTGSTQELQNKNFYICPQVWCPKSKVALTYKDFKEKYNESCPYPDVEEKPILLTNHYWGKGDVGTTREHFPGFLDPKTHPARMCLPCCFKKEAKEGSRNKQNENTCKNQFNEEVTHEEETEVFGNEKYILGEIFVPLEPFRYGLLPKEFNELVGSKACGNGLDGKGLMNDKTDCVLRRGVNQKNQSFLNALISVLDNPAITTLQSFVDNFQAHISIEQFVALENGKIMKLFIKKEYDIFSKTNFSAFSNWFLSKEQTRYIEMFKLKDIANELREVVDGDGFMSNNLTTKSKRSIVREFLIFSAYKQFLTYMSDMSIDKHHNLLIDYVQSEHTWLNVNHYNVVVVEYDPTEGKTHMICPFNRNASDVFDLTDPFVFIFKQNNYYEPLCYVKIKNGNINAKTKFSINANPVGIRRLIQYYMKNCSVNTSLETATDLEIFLEVLIGHKIKRYVVDYSFQVCGFLISKINLFVPLRNKVDIYNLNRTEFVYYDELPKYKCRLDQKTIQTIFAKIFNHTNDKFYIPTYYYRDSEQQLVGFILSDKYFVPTNFDEVKHESVVISRFDDDLNIFVEYERTNARTERVTRDQQIQRYFRTFSTLLEDFITSHKSLNMEYVFIKDSDNPFPKEYKRKKLLEIAHKALKHDEFKEYLQKHIDIEKFTRHFIENILQSSGSQHSVMMRQLFGVKRKFKKQDYELMFDQKDVAEDKIREKIKFIQNPHAALMERVDKYMRDYVFEFAEKTEMSYFSKYLTPEITIDFVPYKFRKLLHGFNVITYNDNVPYTTDTLFDMFLCICKAKKITTATDVATLRHLMKQKMVYSYRNDTLTAFYDNQSYKHTAKLMRMRSHNLENNVVVMDSMTYFPSYFELSFLVEIVRVRVIVVGRQTKTNATGIALFPQKDLYNRYTRFVILHEYYDRFNYRDVFAFTIKDYTSGTPRIIMRRHELPKDILKYLI